MFGLDFRQRMGGSISVNHSELHVHAEDAWLMWEPDHNVVSTEDLVLFLRLERQVNFGSIEIRLVSEKATSSHSVIFGPKIKSVEKEPLLPLYPEEQMQVLGVGSSKNQKAVKIYQIALEGLFKALKNDVANLIGKPLSLEEQNELNKFLLSNEGFRRDHFYELDRGFYVGFPKKEFLNVIASEKENFRWFIRLKGMSDQILRIKHLALADKNLFEKTIDLDQNPEEITVFGKLDRNLTPGTKVEAVLETGERMTSSLSFDNRFAFSGIPKKTPFSIRLNHKGQDYYTDHGRWLALSGDHSELIIRLQPIFENPIGKKASAEDARFVTPRRPPSQVGAIYESHAQIRWPGSDGAIQEYDNRTFTNNYGFLDRDRFFDNPDNCFRILHMGSSHTVALQVPIFQKYNIVMESELGVRLGRCVEVISAGRDNGDISANFPILRDYGKKMQSDLALFENSSALVMQMQPELLALGFGWDAQNNAVPGFLFDESGELVFKADVPDYGLYTIKPTWPELVNDVPFFRTLFLKDSELPYLAEEALEKLGKVVLKMQKMIPEIPIYLHNGLDQAQCRTDCKSNRLSSSGDEGADISVDNFLENHARICDQFKLRCISIPSTTDYTKSDRLLTFKFDGHYSPRGHQWLAKNLTEYFADSEISKLSGAMPDSH